MVHINTESEYNMERTRPRPSSSVWAHAAIQQQDQQIECCCAVAVVVVETDCTSPHMTRDPASPTMAAVARGRGGGRASASLISLSCRTA